VRVQVPRVPLLSGCRRAWFNQREPESAGSNPAIQTYSVHWCSGSAQCSVEAKVRDRHPYAPLNNYSVPLAERQRHRSSKPDRRVQLPQGTLEVGSVGNQADHSRLEREMLRVRVPPEPLLGKHKIRNLKSETSNPISETSSPKSRKALAEQPGVLATLSRWRSWVQIPSGTLTAVPKTGTGASKTRSQSQFSEQPLRRLGMGEPTRP
jgi:hypothetical protein